MISTKYRKEQKQRAKDIKAAKRASKDPTKKDKIKGNKKDHRVRMERRNERIRQRGLFRIAERKRQIEKLKAIIEENKKLQLEKENGVQEENQNEIGRVYEGLLNQPLTEEEGFAESVNPQESLDKFDEVYGELVNKPITHHKSPDDSIEIGIDDLIEPVKDRRIGPGAMEFIDTGIPNISEEE